VSDCCHNQGLRPKESISSAKRKWGIRRSALERMPPIRSQVSQMWRNRPERREIERRDHRSSFIDMPMLINGRLKFQTSITDAHQSVSIPSAHRRAMSLAFGHCFTPASSISRQSRACFGLARIEDMFLYTPGLFLSRSIPGLTRPSTCSTEIFLLLDFL
jgi:hypothetical protein